eukprot:358763-Chlamydomonas_euryale.AAC.10
MPSVESACSSDAVMRRPMAPDGCAACAKRARGGGSTGRWEHGAVGARGGGSRRGCSEQRVGWAAVSSGWDGLLQYAGAARRYAGATRRCAGAARWCASAARWYAWHGEMVHQYGETGYAGTTRQYAGTARRGTPFAVGHVGQCTAMWCKPRRRQQVPAAPLTARHCRLRPRRKAFELNVRQDSACGGGGGKCLRVGRGSGGGGGDSNRSSMKCSQHGRTYIDFLSEHRVLHTDVLSLFLNIGCCTPTY